MERQAYVTKLKDKEAAVKQQREDELKKMRAEFDAQMIEAK